MTPVSAGDPIPTDFAEIARLIESARHQALQAVNTTLIDLYWQVGAHISRKLETAEWGDAVVQQLADYLARTQPGLRGFTRSNLFRMRQFYETYREDETVAPLVRQISWTHHLIILSQCKRPEDRKFYLSMAVQERCGKRALSERVVRIRTKPSAALTQTQTDSCTAMGVVAWAPV
jgi:predicted nuclease of restriction endonuclease-like (RecB) superfamily